MPSWKKIIVSGSDAELNQLTATSFGGNISGSLASTGSFGRVEVPKQTGGGPITLGGGAFQDVIIGDGSGTGDIVLDGNSEATLRYKIGGAEKWFLLARDTNNFVFRRNSADRVTIDTNGNFAIGVNLAPTERLHVGGNIFATGNISGSSTSTGSFGKLLGDGSDLAGIDTDLLGDTTPQLGGNLDLNSNDITGTGNIDITGNITAQNFIVSSSVTSITYQSLSGSTIFGDTADDTHEFIGNTISGSSTSTGSFGRLMLGGQTIKSTTEGIAIVNDSEAYTLLSPPAAFQVVSEVDNQWFVYFRNNESTSGRNYGLYVRAGTNSTDSPFKIADKDDSTILRVSGEGTLGINTNSPQSGQKLHVVGDSFFTGNVSGSSTSTGSFGKLAVGTATIQIPSNGFITMGSEEGMVKNTRFGNNAGQNLQAGGTQNVLIGEDAGGALTTGDKNVVMGVEALKTETGGQNNTAIGHRALKTLNQNSVGGNVALGLGAGEDLATGAFNILIGYAPETQATDDTRSIVIGSEDTVGLGSNTTVIGGASQTLVAFGGPALISGSSTSTGSFGHLMVGGGNFTSASLASAIAGGGGSGISNVVEDSSPQLGGDLELNSNDITGTGNINIAGNLTVLGTTSTISTTNIKIGDPFGFFATGSAGTNVDGGIIIQSGSAVDSGSALYHDISTERWSVAKGIASTATTVTDSEWQGYVATVFTSSGSPVGESPKYGVGEIHIDENGDIFIYS